MIQTVESLSQRESAPTTWRLELSLPAVLGALVGLQGLGGSLRSAALLSVGLGLTVLFQALGARLAGAREIRVHGLGVHATSGGGDGSAYFVALAAPLGSAVLGLLALAPLPELRVIGAVALAAAVLHLLPAWPLALGEVLWVALRSRTPDPRAVTRRSGMLVGVGLCLVGLGTGFLFVVAANKFGGEREPATVDAPA